MREDEQEEEKEVKQEDVEEEEGENHVELLASPDTLSTDLMEFERCAEMARVAGCTLGAPHGKGAGRGVLQSQSF